MKRADQIAALSQEWQLALDALIQSAINEDMYGPVVDAIKTDASAAINHLRDIDEQMYTILGLGYTKEVYSISTGEGFMARAGLPQIQQAGDIKAYYIERLTEILTAITAEIENTQFLGNNVSGTNGFFEKTETWTTAESALEGNVSDLIDTLVADEYDNS